MKFVKKIIIHIITINLISYYILANIRSSFALTLDIFKSIFSDLNIQTQQGFGKINGFEFPIIHLPEIKDLDIFITKLKNKLQGQATIFVEHTDISTVIIISPIYSDICKKCPKPNLNNLSKIIENTFSISIFNIKELNFNFAMLSNSGAFFNHTLQSKNIQVDDPIFTNDKYKINFNLSSEFVFNSSYVKELIGTSELSCHNLKNLINQDLQTLNYKPFNESSSAIENYNANKSQDFAVWKNGKSVISLSLKNNNIFINTCSEVKIYEYTQN